MYYVDVIKFSNYIITMGGWCPAKVIKYRFDEETIKRLEESKWYDLPLDKIKEYSKYFTNPKEFLDILDKDNK